jgi:hypothetical protein
MSKRPSAVSGILCFTLSVGLGFAQVKDRVVYTPPHYETFRPPSQGGSYKDPVFHTMIKRLSDAPNLRNDAASTGAVPFVMTEYSTMSPFNQDNSRFLLQHQSYYGLYDGKGELLKNLPLEVSAGSEPRWSRAESHMLYFHTGNQLKRLDTRTDQITMIHKFSEYTKISGAGESDICFDGNHMVFAGDGRHVFVYDLENDKKGPAFDTAGQPFDSLYLTPEHNVTITWGTCDAHCGIELFDSNMRFVRRLAPNPGHMDVTRDVNGEEILLWFNAADLMPVCENGVVKIRLSDAKQTCVVTFDWSLAVHISATDNSGWFFVETYAPSDPKPGNDWKLYTNEVLQVKLDGSEVRRIAHHRSRPFDSYNYTPRVAASRDGSRILYSSNYGLRANTDYTDAYLVEIEPHPDPLIGGARSRSSRRR